MFKISGNFLVTLCMPMTKSVERLKHGYGKKHREIEINNLIYFKLMV